MAAIGPVILLLALGLGLLGTALLIKGLRGRRQGNLPHCRRCDYPISEADTLASFTKDDLGSSPKCPECGLSLRNEDAIRQGERKRRPAMALFGLLILILAVPAAVVSAGGLLSGSRFVKQSPFVLLQWQLRNSGQQSVEQALNELGGRNLNNALTPDQQRACLEALVGVFARPDINWTATCQQAFAAFEQAAGPLSNEQRSQLARAVGVTINVSHRDRAHPGAETPVEIDVIATKQPPVDMAMTVRVQRVRLGGNEQLIPNGGTMRFQLSPKQQGVLASDFITTHTLHGDLGEQALDVEVEAVLSTSFESGELHRTSVPYSGRIRLIDPSEATIEERTEPKAGQLQQEVTLSRISVRRGSQLASSNISVDVSPLRQMLEREYAFVFDILIVPDPRNAPERQFLIGRFVDNERFGYQTFHASSPLLPGLLATRPQARVILRSNPAWAATRTLHQRIWKGELVYDNVEVRSLSEGRPGEFMPAAPQPLATTTFEDLLDGIKPRDGVLDRSHERVPPSIIELQSRLDRNLLMRPQIDQLVSALLENQRDWKSWSFSQGTLMDDLIHSGDVSEQDEARYYTQIMPPIALSHETRAWVGREWSVNLRHDVYRCGTATDATIEMAPTAIRIDGKDVPVSDEARVRHLVEMDWREANVLSRNIRLPAQQEPGEREVEVDYRVRVWKGDRSQVGVGTPLAESLTTMKVKARVRAADDLGAELMNEEAMGQRLQASVVLEATRAHVLIDADGREGAGGEITLKHVPVDLGLDVVWINAGTPEEPFVVDTVSAVASKPDSRMTSRRLWYGAHVNMTNLRVAKPIPEWVRTAREVRVVLRANPWAGATDTNATRVWAGSAEINAGTHPIARAPLRTGQRPAGNGSK